jgi:small-conductance mechanosensitive channel
MVEEIATNIAKKLDQMGDVVGDWLSENLVPILLILVFTYILRRVLTVLIGRSLHRTIRRDLYPTEKDRKKRIDTLNELVSAIVRVGAWFVAALMIINQLGIDTAPLMASAGVVGIALGFGAQSLIKDFVTGIFIISENQYRIGDVVRIGTQDGTVEAITIRTTILA